jgi:hypothetical protein
MKDIIYIATDRMYAKRMNLYGGYNIYPNIERIAKNGTVFENAQAAAASTLMCHSCEWTGLYPWELHNESNTPFNHRLYETQISSSNNMFTDLIEKDYDIHMIFVTKPGKYFETYKQTLGIWGKKGVNVHLVEDWDINPKNNRRTHLKTCLSAIEMSKKKNKKCFVWVKIHGFYKELDMISGTIHDPLLRYIDYAGQQRVTRDDVWNCIVDEVVGEILDEIGHLKNSDAPEIVFASDHGAFQGEYGMKDYGFHLTQEIIHVPLITSLCLNNNLVNGDPGSNPSIYQGLFSMKNIRNLIVNRSIAKEDMIFSETLYPGQVSNKKMTKHSFSKIAALTDRYKYIYQPWGMHGDNDQFEEMLFDTHYDKNEKINLASFDGKYLDNARGTSGIKKDILMRYHSDPEYCRNPANFFNNLQAKLDKNPKIRITENYSVGTGWNEIDNIRSKFRSACKEIWTNTGRESLIKFQ